MKTESSSLVNLCQISNSILGPNETRLTVDSLVHQESQRNKLFFNIKQRKDHSYPVTFHHDQLLVQLVQEDGNMKVDNLIVPKPAVNRKSYRWDEPQQPTLLNRSKYLRQFRKYHSNSYYKSNTKSGDNPSPHSGCAVDVNKPNVSHNSSTKRKRTNNSCQKSSTNSKRNSPLSVSSLDSGQMAEVQNKLDNLQILLSQINNLKVNDEKIGDSTVTNSKPDGCDVPKMEVLQGQTQEENKPVRQADESVLFQKLPNYVTFSVKKSHQYAVRNWLLSNYNHI